MTPIQAQSIVQPFFKMKLCGQIKTPLKFYMITTEQEAILLRGIKFKNLAFKGVDGEKTNAQRKLAAFLIDNKSTVAQLETFEEKYLLGFRLEYLKKVFYTLDELLAFLKTKSLKFQATALFAITWQLIKTKFFNPKNK